MNIITARKFHLEARDQCGRSWRGAFEVNLNAYCSCIKTWFKEKARSTSRSCLALRSCIHPTELSLLLQKRMHSKLFILLPIVFFSLSSNNVIFHANLDNFLSSFSMHYVIHVGTCWLNPLQFPHFSVHWMFFIKKSFKLSYGWRVICNKNILLAVFV